MRSLKTWNLKSTRPKFAQWGLPQKNFFRVNRAIAWKKKSIWRVCQTGFSGMEILNSSFKTNRTKLTWMMRATNLARRFISANRLLAFRTPWKRNDVFFQQCICIRNNPQTRLARQMVEFVNIKIQSNANEHHSRLADRNIFRVS